MAATGIWATIGNFFSAVGELLGIVRDRNAAKQKPEIVANAEAADEEKAFADIKAVCVMDAGNNGVIILADKMLPPRKHGVLVPGPQAHWMKLAFEKYFLWKTRHGHVTLP